MGLSVANAEAIAREHRYKPITGDVFAIGRQTMFFSPATAIAIVQSLGLPVPPGSSITTETQTRHSDGHGYITSESFFRLLGVDHLRSLDCSAYEGADVICDLNATLPPELHGIADFIVDGSTLDNVWNPAIALQNLCKMLKPGGRIFSVNVGSNHYDPYTILTPYWIFDYLTVNRFRDFRVYGTVFRHDGRMNAYAVDPNAITESGPAHGNLAPRFAMGVCFIAERGAETTTDEIPTQQTYQTPEQRRAFYAALEPIRASRRPDLFFSNASRFLRNRHGYRFISAGSRAEHVSALREWWLRLWNAVVVRL